MTYLINSGGPVALFAEQYFKYYFVDKSMLLEEMINIVESVQIDLHLLSVSEPMSFQPPSVSVGGDKYICITRPRRFGKTVNAQMIAAFFNSSYDSRNLFRRMRIHEHPLFERHLHRHNVVFIDFASMSENCGSLAELFHLLRQELIADAKELFNVDLSEETSIISLFKRLYNEYGKRFIFVIDEWDLPLQWAFMDEPSKKRYILFLSSLLKDSAYVELCYMTGIMPINTYDTGTPLNMFREYTMAGNPRFSEFFGFTDSEVDDLYAKYRKVHENDAHITRDQLRDWYDGYYLNGSRCLYNPKAVINALNENYLTGYWSSSSKYEELYPFIAQNIDEVRDAIAVLISSEGYPARLNQYAAASEILKTKDQIFSAMVVYGFLTSDNGMVYIPNHELMEKFIEMLQNNKALGYLNTLAVASSRVVEATRKMNPGPIEEAIQLVHDKEISLFKYNNEDALGYIVCLAYCAARDTHHFLREEKGGVGLADIILMPKGPSDDCFIIELKVDDSPQNAIRQIKKKRYYQQMLPSFGETREYTGRLILVGISYWKSDPSRSHTVAFEVYHAQDD